MTSKIIWIILALIIVSVLVVQRLTRVSPATAREWLDKGALVIDVRTEAEFQERHLLGAISIPLDRLQAEIGRHAPDKAQPLLLHCASGARSGIGRSRLMKMGYSNTFNLGSYGQAEKLLGANRESGRQL